MTPRERHLKNVYGLSLQQYDELLQLQDYSCAICGKAHADVVGKRLSVDHDHKSGAIRGLLCTFCNRYVIGRHRDFNLFIRAAAYLKKEPQYYVPEANTNRRNSRRRKRKKRITKLKV